MAIDSTEFARYIWNVLDAKGNGKRDQRVFVPFDEIERALRFPLGGTPKRLAEGFAAQHGLLALQGDGGMWFLPLGVRDHV